MATIETTPDKPATDTENSSRGAGGGKPRLEIDRLFEALVKLEGSDLHLKVGQPPFMRVKGSLQPLKADRLGDEQMRKLCMAMLDDRQKKILELDGGCDFAHTCVVGDIKWRFRVNLLYQQGSLGMVARRVNNKIPDFKGLFLPPSIERLCQLDQGMVLLAGVTGSGKSTTIGSMLNYVNQNYRKHILTLEDPIEFVFTEDKCLINQREIGTDVKNFEIGMKHAVREDPDIILVGELRDVETFKTAIHAAETGHLVYGTIHAASASSCIGRILDLFPQEEHPAIR
ncbi:MAG: ATPase, T2SS/T4P/T4SS family, partial [Planctomycetota bacterium]